jgi:type IV secretion system protein TrbC
MRLTYATLAINGLMQMRSSVARFHDIFAGPIAKGLSLVAVVVGGLMFASGESRRRKIWACILFGIGMTVLMANFLAWIFSQ